MLKAFSWVVAGNLARQVAFLLVNAVLFERLSRSTFGALSLAFGYMTVFAGLGEFGIRQIGWRELARRPARAVEGVGPFFVTKSGLSVLALAAYLLAMPLLWRNDLPAEIYLLYGLGVVLNGGTFDFPLFGLDRLDLFAKFSLVAYGLYALACLALVLGDRTAWLVPVAFAGAMVVLFVLSLGWFLAVQGRFRLWPAWSEVRSILIESWPLGLAETLNRGALNYPLILVGLVLGGEAVGNYRIAEMGYSFLAQFGHMFAAAGFSKVSYLFAHRRASVGRAVGRMLAMVGVAALVAGTGVSLVGPLAYEMVFGEVAESTTAVLRLLGVALIFAGPARFLKGLLASLDQQRLLLAVNAAAMAVGATVALLTLARSGILGMAIGILCAEIVSLLALAWTGRRALVSPD